MSQRPSETDYEYAGWLEGQIPARRPEIRTIADARVFGSYSGRGMTADAIEAMQGAWQRLRLPLVWLAVRRPPAVAPSEAPPHLTRSEGERLAVLLAGHAPIVSKDLLKRSH